MRGIGGSGSRSDLGRRVRNAWRLGILLVAARALPAQSLAQREQIEAFRDSLVGAKDSTSLTALEKRLMVRASSDQRDSAMIHVRLGFLALRLGDLGGRKHYEDAASEFQWVVDLQPKWPYGWFGLGFAELGVGDAEFAFFRGLQTALGKDALTRSANDFAHSAEVEPGFVRGLVELSNTAMRQRVNLRMDVALAALRRAAHTPAGHHPDILLARARIEREVGSADSALAAIDMLLQQSPTSSAALLESARVRFRLGRRDGGEPWYRGLATADPATIALYRADLIFALPDSTLRAFDAAGGAARAELIRRFWNFRDRDELHPVGDRLVEHYRRLDFAQRNYRLVSTRRHYDIVERYRPPAVEFDDRGVVYIRQGGPDDRASLELPGLPYNESWVFHRGDAPDLLFHFVAREGVTDFRLVESVFDVLGFANAIRLQGSGNIQGADAPFAAGSHIRPPNISADSAAVLRQRASDAAMSRTADALVRSRANISPIYQRMLAAGRAGASSLQSEERAIGKRSIRVGTSTDSWPRSYAVALPAQVQVLATAGDSNTPKVRVAFAIPATAPVSGRAAEPALPRIRAAVLGFDGDAAAVVDTSVRVKRGSVPGMPDQLLGLVSIPVPAGRFTTRVGLESGRAGIVSRRDTLIIPVPDGPALGLSDLVLGSRTVPLSWISAAGDTVWVNPAVQFRTSDAMELYFETTGVPRDSVYRVELQVTRPGGRSLLQRITGLFGGGGAAIRLGFVQRSVARPDLVHRQIALGKLKPGRYVLGVTVSSTSGEKVTRRQEFSVLR